MPQTSTIAFALIVGFIVFITVRGELPSYLGVLGIGSKPAPAATSVSSTGGLPSLLPIPSLLGG